MGMDLVLANAYLGSLGIKSKFQLLTEELQVCSCSSFLVSKHRRVLA